MDNHGLDPWIKAKIEKTARKMELIDEMYQIINNIANEGYLNHTDQQKAIQIVQKIEGPENN